MNNRIRCAIATLALAPIAGFAQTLAPSQDAYYVLGNGSNFGTATTITVGSSGSIGLVQFDLTQLPAGLTAAQIQKATLTVFLNHVNTGGSINIDTVSASTPWGELTVTGNSGIARHRSEHVGDDQYGEYVHRAGCDGGRAGLDYHAELEQRLHDAGEFGYERSIRQ